MLNWLRLSITILCCLIMAAYSLVFFAFGVEMLQRSGVSVVSLVPTFLGVLLGFISARIGEWAKAKLDKAKKRKDVAAGVIRSLESNGGLLNQANNLLAQGTVPTFPMDGGFLEYARSEIHSLIPNMEDAAAIEHARYEIRHFDSKLEMLRSTRVQYPIGGHILNTQIQSALLHIPIVERAIRLALEAVKKYEKTSL